MNTDKQIHPGIILIEDPLRDTRRRNKRSLLFFTTVALVAAAYGSDSIKIPLANIPSSALIGAIGCVVIYFLVSFLVDYTTDVEGWHMKQRNAIGEEQLAQLTKISQELKRRNCTEHKHLVSMASRSDR